MRVPFKMGSQKPQHISNDLPIQGILKFHLNSARNLPKTDLLGSCDGFVVLELGSQKFRSKVIKNKRDPVWDEDFQFNVSDFEKEILVLTLYDYNLGTSNTLIGTIRIPVREYDAFDKEEWIPLKDAKSGDLNFKISYDEIIMEKEEEVSVDEKVAHDDFFLKTQNLEVPHEEPSSEFSITGSVASVVDDAAPTCGSMLLYVTIVKAENLPNMKNFIGTSKEIDPYVKLSVGKISKRTGVKKRTSSPIWNEDFDFKVSYTATTSLRIEVKDKEMVGRNKLIGYANVPISGLPEGNTVTQKLALTNDVKLLHNSTVEINVRCIRY